jgi:protein KRI1
MNTLRRKDDTRRDKRLARKERKAAERAAKEEKLRRLKNAKRQEMEQKLKQVKAVLGSANDNKKTIGGDKSNNKEDDDDNDDVPIDEAAIMKLLEGDFDPEKFEQSMQEAFGDNFYDKEDAEWKTDEDVSKALREDGEVDYNELDEDEADLNVDDDDAGREEHSDEQDDSDEDQNQAEEEGEETELEKKVRAKMMDKLYELDYEDIVAGMPTRFKYREVEPNNYGLTTEEILLARDQTLKEYVSLKKMAPYREGEEYRVTSRKRRKFREQLRQDVEEAEKRLKEQGITVNDNHGEAGDDNGPAKKKRRRLKKSGEKSLESKRKEKPLDADENENVHLTNASEAADEKTENMNTKRRRKKKGKKLGGVAADQNVGTNQDSSDLKAVPAEMPKANPPSVNSSKHVEALSSEVKQPRKKKKKKDRNKVSVEGVSAARLASYGL